MKKVAVIMGSDSDLPVLKGAFEQLKKLGIPYEAHVYSAHRTPVEAAAFARGAREQGFGVLTAAAGKAALESMTRALLERYGTLPLVYAGGVMSCSIIRRQMEERFGGIFADPQYSSDNSAGIAILAAACAGALREPSV